MRRAIHLAGVLAVVVALAMAPHPAAALTGRELMADAQFKGGLLDPGNTCVTITTNVSVQQRKGPDHWTELIVDVVYFDDCVTDDYGLVKEYYVVAPLRGGEFIMNPNLRQARLDTTAVACNLVDETDCLTLSLDLTWEPAGEVVEDGSTASRAATASGTIMSGARNLAPDAAVFAEMRVVN